ncbi:chemokine XC receptor 1-like [Pseudorasbora parva]|uniref:chemokine XC receptor 1-like n=1 Tax=Pseudorasbora parva TaxID=51549 RepID=UPI00351E784E
MDNSTVNFTTPENSTNSISPIDCLEISLYCINLLFSLPTHSYMIWLIVTRAGSGIASEIFTLNLCVCEIGVCLNSLVSIPSRWISILEKFDAFLMGLSFTGRPLFQCLMCVERYLAVVYPVTFLKFKPLRYRAICCTVVWIINLCSCFYSLFIAISHNTQLHTWFFSLQVLLFFVIQLFCLVAVLRALKQSGPGERGRERKEKNHMKRRAFYLILITTVNMIILYFPFATTGISVILHESFWERCNKFFTLDLGMLYHSSLQILSSSVRVIVLLEGEPSAQSEDLSTLEKVFIQNIPVLCRIHLSLNCN